MEYTLAQPSEFWDPMIARLNALDGQGLTPPATGAVPNINKQLASLQTDLGQLVASFESQLSTMMARIILVQNLINTLTGTPQVTT